jgi:hypothetical protein
MAVYYFVVSDEPSYCPICNDPLFKRSWRSRTILNNSDEKKEIIYIRRLFCDKCGCLHHELPDFIVPYKRHRTETYESIINGETDGLPCENRTIRRTFAWWSIMLPYFLNILNSLTEKYKIKFNNPPLFKEIIRAAANTNNWIFVNSICTRSVTTSGS